MGRQKARSIRTAALRGDDQQRTEWDVLSPARRFEDSRQTVAKEGGVITLAGRYEP